ncbi:tRNA (uridine(34)/cytosine(34)/5-carboxymethylaminomethyluridine(34)-2'-O)-methyltransferase TrmL [Heliobacterium gestii]|uniref:Putative tRNA (cytidine(34)-2'-O)-methyltransferase n=1 Tax=Heliomicrobium gestii TaxID=2699 RepID=A0A845LJL0_HELGE|nr:tRNA (uridine(34)/cytosine(34)/5-carboxymethylaminomethyluridine(34)-2'-O)-methyltransferase TrmL [Heliomicrobium gestii]MBM7867336.1 tRNA (cytidine/uridine-2'-O-)-methyltransferase [Heliomicrobium gestii]MZP43603.1 tRNA (uridine(34)/cytosine(34)/5-carboxymethylaminomethyluridine(34)-2'-O)-methyltransferase TrmL [Heliomicrobium gestii]
MFHIVLVEPEIPPNTGNVARLCAGTGCELHLIRPLGFSIDDKQLKRAGLDYWHLVKVHVHDSWAAFIETHRQANLFFLSTKGKKAYHEFHFRPGDFLVFGKETKGLPEAILNEWPERVTRIPLAADARSLNLSNAVAVVVFEGLRQNGFAGLL